MSPSGKREVAGNDSGPRAKLCLQFFGKPLHDIGEEITKYYVSVPDIHIPEIAPPYLNSFHPESTEPRQRVSERIHFEPHRPDAIASRRFSENPSVPTADVDQKVIGLHRHMIQEGSHSDMRGWVEHGSLGNGKDGYKGKSNQQFERNETPYCDERNDYPGRHILTLTPAGQEGTDILSQLSPHSAYSILIENFKSRVSRTCHFLINP
jgi:hypothetical protein